MLVAFAPAAFADVVTQLPDHSPDNVIALTFDACETRTPAFLDTTIADYLVDHKIPFTIFVSGRFARHNREALAALAKHDFVDLENHSLDHDNHLDQQDDATIRRQVTDNEALLLSITGRRSRFFRFPAGNVNPRALKDVEDLGYTVVHWRWASGDPDRAVTVARLEDWVLTKARPGDILIFHINGRGWSTGQALPDIVSRLQRKGYRFTTLSAALP